MSMTLKETLPQEKNPVHIDKLIQHSIDLLKTGIARDIPPSSVASDGQEDQVSIDHIARAVYICTDCELCITRKNTVPGEGVKNPLVLVVGEAPGAYEDAEGRPFVGKSGQYLDKWLEGISLSRHKNVYITNTVKCRPPGNRNPHPEEIHACHSFLQSQIKVLQPKILFALGRIAAHVLTGTENTRLNDMRHKEYFYQNIPLRVTYHPSAVLRNTQELRPLVWDDLQGLRRVLDKVTQKDVYANNE